MQNNEPQLENLNRFGPQEGRKLVESLSRPDKAYIERAAQLNPSAIRVQTFDLSIAPANPISIGFAFKTLYVVEATDASSNIQMRPFSESENNDYLNLKLKDVLSYDNPINKCFIKWNAQAGKTLTIAFFTDAKFTSGSFVNEVSSSVDGNSIVDFGTINISTTGANLVDSSVRNLITIQNEGPDDCYIGSNSVSAVPGSEIGLRVPAYTERTYKNTASIYAASVGSSKLRFQNEV